MLIAKLIMKTKEKINIVWLKRDLRLQDNEAFENAIKSPYRFLIVYVFENSILNDTHYSERHFNFIKESLYDLNVSLSNYNSKILIVQSEIIPTFNLLLDKYDIKSVFSHQETGISVTYLRDQSFKRYCKNNKIEWKENVNNGIVRGLKNRNGWALSWKIIC